MTCAIHSRRHRPVLHEVRPARAGHEDPLDVSRFTYVYHSKRTSPTLQQTLQGPGGHFFLNHDFKFVFF